MTTLEDYLGPLAAKMPEPNYIDPQTRVSIIMGIEVPVTVLMVFFLSARLYTRITVTRMGGWDDVIMGIAGVLAVVEAIVLCLGTNYGVGYHLWDMRPQDIPMANKMIGASSMLSYPTLTLSKISVCLGYQRLFPGKENWWFCCVLMIYCGMWGVSAFFTSLFKCTPLSLAINQPFSHKLKCIHAGPALLSLAALNSLGDLLVFLWPAWFLFNLQMPLKHRLGLITLFSLGCCVVTMSILRMVWLIPNYRTIDIFYHQSKNFIAMSVEGNLGIICGCLPIVKAFLAHFFPNIFSTTRRSTNTEGGGNSTKRRRSSCRKHHQGGSRTDPAFSFSYLGGKDREGYELHAVDSSCDLDERRLIADVEVIPVSGIVKKQEFVVRTLAASHEDRMAEMSQSSHVKAPVSRTAEDMGSMETGGS